MWEVLERQNKARYHGYMGHRHERTGLCECEQALGSQLGSPRGLVSAHTPPHTPAARRSWGTAGWAQGSEAQGQSWPEWLPFPGMPRKQGRPTFWRLCATPE